MITCSKLLIIKISELALVAIILAIHVNEPFCNPEDKFLSAGTEVAYLIILVGLFAGGWVGTPVHRNVDLFFLVIGCGLFIASGATTIDLWTRVVFRDKYRDMALARASLSILEGVVFLIDTFFTYRGEKFVR
ncbi:uncharacterized protein [Fopius arisanus]|uniref:Uncharacterized protein n=1 Tax=Fopius arisanus TaxID=64838 RepID=A0A9R1TCY5_9HYME|nr:PREDICTED: uncharacterized protein LOC105268861 [Fopius arisanus]